MKIRLVNYPYKEYEIGEVVDLGEKKNVSMVSIKRAVWEEEPKKKPIPKKKAVKLTEEPKEEEKAEEVNKDETKESDGPARDSSGKFVSKKDTKK